MGQTVEYLTPAELIARWNGAVKKGTLDNWRSQGKGPAFVKFGSRVRYPLAKVIAWEAVHLQANDNEPNGKPNE